MPAVELTFASCDKSVTVIEVRRRRLSVADRHG
jgi:hypothetical protein